MTMKLLIAALCALCMFSTPAFAADEVTLSSTDYANVNNWVRFDAGRDKKVDVFAVYPTVTSSTAASDRPYVRLNSHLMRERAAAWLSENEGIVSEEANIYAPLYRQLNAVELEALNSDTFASYTNGAPREDIFAAFDYYLTHINKGERPFIIFGHSQGAHLSLEVASLLLGNARYAQHNKNHLITYAIGCAVTKDQISRNPHLKFAQGPADLHVIASWSTTAPSEAASGAYKNFGNWKAGALIINPISWKTDETPAPAPAGASANAIVDNEHSLLVTTTVDENQYQSALGVISRFHVFDIQFYYDSIKQNVKDRIAAFKGMGG